ncbi:MAG: GAF domain-containing protein [Solirubrobacteraceae bacterium]
MPGDRMSTVLRAMADADVGGRSIVDRVCFAAVELLALRGAGLSLIVDGQLRGTAGVSYAGVAGFQELQLALGEGPCVEAWRGGAAVLEPDLADPRTARWPAFQSAGLAAGVSAVFAFPLRIGAICIGVLVLYRDETGPLSSEELALALVLADLATQIVLSLQAGAAPDTLHELLADEPPHWAEVHQATGILSVQLGVPLDEAFVRLRAHAFASGETLRLVARAVVSGQLRFKSSP